MGLLAVLAEGFRLLCLYQCQVSLLAEQWLKYSLRASASVLVDQLAMDLDAQSLPRRTT